MIRFLGLGFLLVFSVGVLMCQAYGAYVLAGSGMVGAVAAVVVLGFSFLLAAVNK